VTLYDDERDDGIHMDEEEWVNSEMAREAE